ncbi:MAG: hypothetical protein J6V17_02780 [Bacteroidales bacterium]|nr:hypothetical protein [Bacteroidales bacterium]
MKLKRLLSILAILVSVAADLMGQESAPYFCNVADTVLEYIRTTSEGDVKWYHTMRIGTVHETGDSAQIDYTSHILNHKHKPYYGDEPAELSASITKGMVTLDVAESVAAVFRTMLPSGARITSSGGESSLPSDMVPGDVLPDVNASVKALGLTMKITVTERNVLRNETLSTPAGTFDCVVIRERKVEKGMGRNRHTIADTWYSRGIGMVRHDTYSPELELQTSEVLTVIR